MLLHDSRRDARVDAGGELVLLEDQDRSRWDRDEIDEGARAWRPAARRGRAVRVQAAIAAEHARGDRDDRLDARSPRSTTRARRGRAARRWSSSTAPSPWRWRRAPSAGLALLDALEGAASSTATTCSTPPAPTCCAGSGASEEAAAAYRRARELAANPAERALPGAPAGRAQRLTRSDLRASRERLPAASRRAAAAARDGCAAALERAPERLRARRREPHLHTRALVGRAPACVALRSLYLAVARSAAVRRRRPAALAAAHVDDRAAQAQHALAALATFVRSRGADGVGGPGGGAHAHVDAQHLAQQRAQALGVALESPWAAAVAGRQVEPAVAPEQELAAVVVLRRRARMASIGRRVARSARSGPSAVRRNSSSWRSFAVVREVDEHAARWWRSRARRRTRAGPARRPSSDQARRCRGTSLADGRPCASAPCRSSPPRTGAWCRPARRRRQRLAEVADARTVASVPCRSGPSR